MRVKAHSRVGQIGQMSSIAYVTAGQSSNVAAHAQTDLLIQRTIRRVFAERTTLTIAHRLDTIIFSDKILAMAQGQVRSRRL